MIFTGTPTISTLSLFHGIKNVPWHILAPAAVACDIIIVRRSAHPAGGFLYNRKYNFLLYKKEYATGSFLSIISCSKML